MPQIAQPPFPQVTAASAAAVLGIVTKRSIDYSLRSGYPGVALSRYDPLRDYLAGLTETDVVEMSFSEVEGLAGQLPSSARLHRSWWANRAGSLAWGAAGWHVQSVQMAAERVVFARGAIGRRRRAVPAGPWPAATVPAGTTVTARSGWAERAAPAEDPTGAGSHSLDAGRPGSSQAITGSLRSAAGQEAAPGRPDSGAQPVPQAAPAPLSAFQSYVTELHIPLLAVLLVLCVVLGGFGFGLRPGTDEPPAVPSSRIQLYVYQQKSMNGLEIGPSRVDVDEIMIQKGPSTVEVQIDLFGAFSHRGQATWDLLTGISQAQPRPCPDLYHYLGTAHNNPVAIENARLSIGGYPATPTVMGNFEGHRVTKTAADTLGLQGYSPGPVRQRSRSARRNQSLLDPRLASGVRR